MKKVGSALRIWGAGIGCALLLLALACGSPGGPTPVASAPAPSPTPSPKAVVVSVDGLRPDALQHSAAPNIQALARRGAAAWKAQTTYQPVTLSAHASMLSGYSPSSHGMTWNEWEPQRGYITVPTVFSIAKAAGLSTAMVVGKLKLQHLGAPGTVDSFVMAARGDQEVANEAVARVGAFDLLFVHFADVDVRGHEQGWLSAAYLAQVAETDEAVGRLLSALPPQTTVVLTSDHGGRGRAHGSNIPEDMTIPWIIAGPKVAAGRELSRAVDTTDTAATVLYVFGLGLSPGAKGEVVAEAFASP